MTVEYTSADFESAQRRRSGGRIQLQLRCKRSAAATGPCCNVEQLRIRGYQCFPLLSQAVVGLNGTDAALLFKTRFILPETCSHIDKMGIIKAADSIASPNHNF